MNTLKSRLRDFKLSGIYNSLEDRISYANEKSLSHIELLELLFEDETNNRINNSYKKRYAKANKIWADGHECGFECENECFATKACAAAEAALKEMGEI